MSRFQKIRELPCVSCGKPNESEVCHSNFGEHGKGMGKKANDIYTIPMCRRCHQNFDQYRNISRAEAKERFRQWHAITEIWLKYDCQDYVF